MATISSRRSVAWSVVVLGLASVAVSGCATKGFVRKEVAQVRTEVEAARAYTDTRVAEARARADEAWAKASLAERLGSGDFSEVSSHQVQFAFDDYRLDPSAQSMLDQLGGTLSSHPHFGLEVRGYADAVGEDRYNYRLGRERADEVLRYMITRYNVSPNRVATISFGEESPIADNESDDGRAQNRRVQVRLLEIKMQEPLTVIP